MTGNPRQIWRRDPIRVRNWAIVTVLALAGLRDGELRQLTLDDVDANRSRMLVARRHDDPDDPRLREPNAKTADRLIPVLDIIAERIEDYIYGPQGDAAEATGSNFSFLSHGSASFGRPISRRIVYDAVRDLARHTGVSDLHPTRCVRLGFSILSTGRLRRTLQRASWTASSTTSATGVT